MDLEVSDIVVVLGCSGPSPSCLLQSFRGCVSRTAPVAAAGGAVASSSGVNQDRTLLQHVARELILVAISDMASLLL